VGAICTEIAGLTAGYKVKLSKEGMLLVWHSNRMRKERRERRRVE
jgi:hypothetical protein